MLRFFVFLGAAAAAAAAAGCSDTCTHPGVKVIELAVGDTVQDCSGYGPGLATPATADECKEAMLATGKVTQADMIHYETDKPDNQLKFDLCFFTVDVIGNSIGNGGLTDKIADGPLTQFCKCSACPPASSSSTGTGWTLLGIALGAGSAGGAIAYGAAQAP